MADPIDIIKHVLKGRALRRLQENPELSVSRRAKDAARKARAERAWNKLPPIAARPISSYSSGAGRRRQGGGNFVPTAKLDPSQVQDRRGENRVRGRTLMSGPSLRHKTASPIVLRRGPKAGVSRG